MILLASVCYGDFCWGLLLLLLFLSFFFFLKILFDIASLSTWSWVIVSNQNFTDGFLLKFHPSLAIAWYPQSSALFRLQLQKQNSSQICNVFYRDRKTDLKLWCDCCIKFQLFEGAQDAFARLTVACYYPTTPTDYPSTTRGMSVEPPVVVHIDFCGYLKFFSISFIWITWVQYATDNLYGQQLEFIS